MNTINVYSIGELSPKAFERARREYIDDFLDILPWQDEIFKSFEELFKRTCRIKLKDFSIGIYTRPMVRVVFDRDEAADLTGARAFAWLENNLLASLRIPFDGERRKEVMKYGADYRPGMIEPCPLTGYCFDDTLLEALQKSIKDGDTLKEAFENLGVVVTRELESEYEYEISEKGFREIAELNDYRFLDDGRIV